MGLHTSWVKTKLQNIDHGPPPQSASVDGHLVEVTHKFVYLGSTVNSTGYSSTDILRRLGLASSVRPSLAPESAESSHQAYVCPGSRLLRCLNLDSVKERLTKAIQAFHMTCQRRILGIRWNDFITNKAVADTTNLPSTCLLYTSPSPRD